MDAALQQIGELRLLGPVEVGEHATMEGIHLVVALLEVKADRPRRRAR